MSTFLNDSQVNQLLGEVAKGLFPLRNYCMIYLMLVHGLRIKEVMALRVQDVDLINGWLCIRRSFKGVDDTHPLTDNGQRLLAAWRSERGYYGESGPDSALFVTRRGRSWSRSGLIKLLNELSSQLPFCVTSSVLYKTTWESLLSLPAREREVYSYLGRNKQPLSWEQKQTLQRTFAFWHKGIEWVLERALRSQNGPKCLLVWIIRNLFQVLSVCPV